MTLLVREFQHLISPTRLLYHMYFEFKKMLLKVRKILYETIVWYVVSTYFDEINSNAIAVDSTTFIEYRLHQEYIFAVKYCLMWYFNARFRRYFQTLDIIFNDRILSARCLRNSIVNYLTPRPLTDKINKYK